ncbi:MAG: phage holin family protein [Eubacterium sp.]|nr:phage holin family protein [Eubacterium sp.]
MKTRLKSPVVWLAVLAQICVIITLFVPDIENTVKTVGVCIIEILTLFGILNNPTDEKSF